MRLMKKAIVRGSLVYLLLDGLLAYVAAELLGDQDSADFGLFLVCLFGLWLVSAAIALRRWTYRAITTYLARSDLTELYRRRMVEAGVPAPPSFDAQPDHYLSQVADDVALPDSARMGAMAILCEIVQAPANKGLLVGYFMREAAGEALNKMR